MTPIILFRKAYDSENEPVYGIIQGQSVKPIEKIGPDGFEKYAHIMTNQASTFPHIDVFKTLNDIYDNELPIVTVTDEHGETTEVQVRDHCNIVLSGNTHQYTMKTYEDTPTTLSQYFLENPTRDGIQYLIYTYETVVNEEKELHFEAFIPGLLYGHDRDDNGKVLGFIKSHVADESSSHKIIIELPYKGPNASYNEYYLENLNIGSWAINKNTIVISGVTQKDDTVILTDGTYSVSFKIFNYGYDNGAQSFVVKNANEYGDYTIAAQLKTNNVKNVLGVLSKLNKQIIDIPPRNSGDPIVRIQAYFPETFISLLNNTPSEEVDNITPNIYNVPVAFVPTNNGKVFMTDVLGVSTNKILNGAIQ